MIFFFFFANKVYFKYILHYVYSKSFLVLGRLRAQVLPLLPFQLKYYRSASLGLRQKAMVLGHLVMAVIRVLLREKSPANKHSLKSLVQILNTNENRING